MKISSLLLVLCLLAVSLFSAGCPSVGAGKGYSIAGKWKVSEFRYRGNDQTNTFSDWTFDFKENGVTAGLVMETGDGVEVGSPGTELEFAL